MRTLGPIDGDCVVIPTPRAIWVMTEVPGGVRLCVQKSSDKFSPVPTVILPIYIKQEFIATLIGEWFILIS